MSKLLRIFLLIPLAAAGNRSPEPQREELTILITVGDSHACVLLASGAVECWGDNWLRQTGAATQ